MIVLVPVRDRALGVHQACLLDRFQRRIRLEASCWASLVDSEHLRVCCCVLCERPHYLFIQRLSLSVNFLLLLWFLFFDRPVRSRWRRCSISSGRLIFLDGSSHVNSLLQCRLCPPLPFSILPDCLRFVCTQHEKPLPKVTLEKNVSVK